MPGALSHGVAVMAEMMSDSIDVLTSLLLRVHTLSYAPNVLAPAYIFKCCRSLCPSVKHIAISPKAYQLTMAQLSWQMKTNKGSLLELDLAVLDLVGTSCAFLRPQH